MWATVARTSRGYLSNENSPFFNISAVVEVKTGTENASGVIRGAPPPPCAKCGSIPTAGRCPVCEASSVPAWSEITERYEEGEPHDGSPAKERSAYVFVLGGNASSEDWRSVKQSLVTFLRRSLAAMQTLVSLSLTNSSACMICQGMDFSLQMYFQARDQLMTVPWDD